MKIASIVSILIIISWSALTITEVWFDVVSAEIYWKITLTMALVGGGVVIASLIAKEYFSEKQMKKDKFID